MLLRSGYDPNLDHQNPLGLAVERRNLDLVKLLVTHGADIRRVPFPVVCAMGDRSVIDFFIAHGIDPATDDAVARAIISGVRPMLGVVRSYREQFPTLQRQVDMALNHYADKGSPKWLSLLLWVGADPCAHVPASPDTKSWGDDSEWNAVERLVHRGDLEILKKICLDPERADLDRLLSIACFWGKPEAIRFLVEQGANPNGTSDGRSFLTETLVGLRMTLEFSRNPYSAGSNHASLDALIACGAKWNPRDGREIRDARDCLQRMPRLDAEQALATIAQPGVCTDEALIALLKTPAIQRHLEIMPVDDGTYRHLRPELRKLYRRLGFFRDAPSPPTTVRTEKRQPASRD